MLYKTLISNVGVESPLKHLGMIYSFDNER